ncbi:hypothetical protein [Bradyrhizobium sp. G127]|jgi:hypothetical protein|uniref:hypothetical protein n=1 Tax=Bradyrhizobium sp. G127 TaxID=2904800 RepID=UPI001F2478CD|nr:hypothetical protein [Bradyrhizobium sp. G127]MCF2523539.1 hypothetical protein [Bradyrhizobium sp. G127]
MKRSSSRIALATVAPGYHGRFMLRTPILISVAALAGVPCSALHAEPVPVVCTILPGGEAASVLLTNPLNYTASCQANCKFSTAVYDDNPQIICAKPVPAGKQVEMCILKAAGNKLLKLVEGTADCKRP